MIKLKHLFWLPLVLTLTALLSGCDLAVLDPKGLIAADEKHLMFLALELMFIVVIPVIILTFVISRRYRASNTKAKYTPDWSHSVLLELVWWSIPLAIVVVLATMTWVSSHRLDPYKPLNSDVKPITIQAVALEWRWLFIYPEQHIATLDFVQFPVNTPVAFYITADAPMNSFQIPQLAGQIYAMAGMQTQLHLIANEMGDFNGRSVSFSGPGFSGMTFIARASSAADFDSWVKSVKQSGKPLSFDSYAQLAEPSEDATPQNFSLVTDDLFQDIIKKYTVPPTSQKTVTQAVSATSN